MRLSYSIVLIMGLLFSPWTVAAEMTVEQFIQQMVRQHHWSESWLRSVLSQAKKHDAIIKLMTPPKTGKARPWYEYRNTFLTQERIDGGVQFWQSHADALRRAEQHYGVPAEYLVSIIGVETYYGRIMGNYRVLDALYTLAFYYPRRAEFFRGELEHFLFMIQEEGFDPLSMTGSYAGAMGLGQFIPSSYRRYAVDFTGDGKRNIWSDETDAIGSIANYFRQHGWQPNQPVIEATQVRPESASRLLALEFKPIHSLGQLKKMGLLYQGKQPDNEVGLLIDLEIAPKKMGYWVGFNNFYVITRYNRSNRYAMAVHQLAQEIAHAYAAAQGN
ncbi:lytic murein transglycosylase B [Thioflexithrix psekupsensis]|uniref:Lytic murein transglycosylase B n=1 Tax=Thioflexithrix psekupsensis TaxID=1570016 RepID=A0A251X503_9GAMM|nr:lytic murein transglycosylase B [Thioflexithrix psekupsensis]OUD12574.1 lytic murein transglycosylase B [Thioflexithrix psekupsensis]